MGTLVIKSSTLLQIRATKLDGSDLKLDRL